jgi:hypothetical protein
MHPNRFYFYEYGNDPKEGFPDIFLGYVDLIALSLSLLMAISPPKWWMFMIPCGSSLFLFAPFFMLREYWKKKIINGRMTEEQKSLNHSRQTWHHPHNRLALLPGP